MPEKGIKMDIGVCFFTYSLGERSEEFVPVKPAMSRMMGAAM